MSIRSLRPDEPIPTDEPKRYPNAAGYVRLRWRVGPKEYVEVYEHRLLAGLPEGKQVHHRNKVKDDNNAANLEVLTPRKHSELHADEERIDYGPVAERVKRGERLVHIAQELGI